MKAQYVGDIGDFGKVLILKHLAGLGFKIGINWVLTKNDNRADGKHRDYIDYRGRHCLCCCDGRVFEQIMPLAKKEREHRKIEDLQDLIRSFSESVVFYSRIYAGGEARRACERNAFGELPQHLADIVFFDPDNGVGGEDGTSSKHVYFSELKRYWARGQSILTYHHLNRNVEHPNQLIEIKAEFHNAFPDGRLCVYHMRRGTARVYILCVRDEHLPRIRDKDSIPAIKPLTMTKQVWATAGEHCEKDHWAEPSQANPSPSTSEPTAFYLAAFLRGRVVKASKNQTTTIGYVNKNGQVVIRNTGLAGTDHGQSVYELGCSLCGHVYGANGSDIHLRKCPKCQDGKPGLPIE
jgi:hypothetical protein